MLHMKYGNKKYYTKEGDAKDLNNNKQSKNANKRLDNGIKNIPIISQNGSYRLQLSNLSITDKYLPLYLSEASAKLSNTYSQAMDSKIPFEKVPLIEITLNRNELTDASVPVICEFIRKNSSIKSLEMLSNKLTDESSPYFRDIITNSDIQRLKIGDNLFTAKGASIIAQGLKQAHPNFLQIHIGGNKQISGEGIKAICESCYEGGCEIIGLRDIDIDQIGWESIGKMISSRKSKIRDIQFKRNTLNVDIMMAIQRGIVKDSVINLTNLTLNSCSITGKEVSYLFEILSTCESLSQLDIGNNQIQDEGFEYFIKWLESGHKKHFSILSAKNIGITSNGILSLVNRDSSDSIANCFKSIDLGYNNLSLAGSYLASFIQKATELERIYLHHCFIEPTHISEICCAIRLHPRIKEVDFSSNYNTHLNAVHWANIVYLTTTLEHLILTDNEFTAEDTSKIAESLLRTTGRSIVILQLGGLSKVPPIGNVVLPDTYKKLNEALKRNQACSESQMAIKQNFIFEPSKLRANLGYPAFPIPQSIYSTSINNAHQIVVQPLRSSSPLIPIPSLHSQLPQQMYPGNPSYSMLNHHQQQSTLSNIPQYFVCKPIGGPSILPVPNPFYPMPTNAVANTNAVNVGQYNLPSIDNSLVQIPSQLINNTSNFFEYTI